MGCASGGPTPAAAVPAADPNATPEWYDNPPLYDDALSGVGLSSAQMDNLRTQQAEAAARTSIAYTLRTVATAMITDYAREAGAGAQAASLKFIESIARQITAADLRGAAIVQRKTINGTTYALATYSKADAAKAAADIIENEASLYAEFKAMNAVDAMNAALREANLVPEPVTK
jgi:hypothetical protein